MQQETVVRRKELVKFKAKGVGSFFDEVKSEVADYLAERADPKRVRRYMRLKAVAMVAMYFVPFAVIVSGLAAGSSLLFFAMWIIMGFGLAGIGTGVMHDANHGSFPGSKRTGELMGGLLNVIGGYSVNWKIQHNILHHTYTNIEGLDDDINGSFLLRMSPQKPWLKVHRAQHLYCWLLYGIMNVYWVTVKDFKGIFEYHRHGLLRKQKISLGRALTELIAYRIFYYGYALVLPILFSGMSWGIVVLGWLAMQVMAGLLLACIFQPAHVMESSTFPEPDEQRRMGNSWALHQLANTTNFAPRNWLLTWYAGGLNYQIEHHLFPLVSHMHYPALSRIVSRAARRHGLDYNVEPTFFAALRAHARMLKLLGKGKMMA